MTTIVERYPQRPYSGNTEENVAQVQANAAASSWKLKPEYKEQWLAALRSGKYEQGRGRLAAFFPSGTQYCCLGVLAVAVSDFKQDSLARCYIYGPEGVPAYASAPIPIEIQRLLGSFNDCEGWNFDQIANWIEDNL